jgi:hypothetical protein
LHLFLGLAQASPVVWAQDEDEITLDDAEFEDDGGAGEDEVSFDDFGDAGDEADEDSGLQNAEETPPAPDEEMTLEPLEGDEDQVTEAPEEPQPPAAETPAEPTPEEFTPPPPAVAEPSAEPEPEPTPEPVADSPDLDLESRLYDIYVNYHSKKLTSDEWSALIGERESETYQIQRGDTLWGISQTFFNDGNYWPKIWQLNSSITNPHLIQPGNTIRFLLGTESDTPAFSVTEANQEPVEMPAGEGGAAAVSNDVSMNTTVDTDVSQSTESQGGGGGVQGTPSDEVEIPPPSETYPPVLKRLPPSLPEWALQRRGQQYDDAGIDYGRRPILDLQDKKFLESFVDEANLRQDGQIKEVEGGARTAATFQYVFVTLPPGMGKPGDRYTVIKRVGKLPRVNKEVASTDMAYLYRVQGEVVLEDLLSSHAEKDTRSDVFRALVAKTLAQIEIGAMVVKGTLPTVSVDPSGEKSDALTQIVGAHLIDSQKTLALHTLAFISGGRSTGLREGQILTVRANTRLRNANSIIKESYIPVGQLKVTRVGEKYSTAIVLKVWDAILVGDVTGAGKVLPPTPPERRGGEGSGARASAAPPPAGSGDELELDDMDDGDIDATEYIEESADDADFDDFEGLDEEE